MFKYNTKSTALYKKQLLKNGKKDIIKFIK